MAGLTDTEENGIIDWYLRGQAKTPPATVYVALFTVAPNDAGSGGTEVSGGSYARVAVTSSMANWAGTQGAGTTVASTGSGGTTSNNNAITFPAPTANWGTVVAAALMSASSGGTMLASGAVSPNQAINNGQAAPSYPAGTLVFTLD
jgi:hypothetical protein